MLSAPSSPPVKVTAMTSSSTSIDVMWGEVDPIDQNGIITSYEVQYIPLNDFGGQISSNSTFVDESVLFVSLEDLQENVDYNVTVRAFTSEGAGPASDNITVLTLQDGQSISNQNIYLFIFCPVFSEKLGSF